MKDNGKSSIIDEDELRIAEYMRRCERCSCGKSCHCEDVCNDNKRIIVDGVKFAEECEVALKRLKNWAVVLFYDVCDRLNRLFLDIM